MTQRRVKEIAKELLPVYAQLLLGCVISALAYPMFLVPNNIAPGGLTGIATIFHHLWQWPVGTVSLLLNIPLFVVGYKAMGRTFVLRSFIATVVFSVMIDLFMLKPVTMDPLLACLFGGVLLGIGLGFILRAGATTGGTDMIARMVHRRMPMLSVGMFLFLIDCMVVLAAGFTMGATEALYALICIFVSGKAIDMVVEGLNTNRACFIMSPAWEKVSQRIMHEMERGTTQLTAKGGYTGQERPVVLCVTSRQEVARIKEIVRQEDKNAFMFVTEAHEALGEGFSAWDKET